MKCLSADDVQALKVTELGLDPTALNLSSVEAIAGALRRAASFLCPCAPRTLVRSVMLPLRGMVNDFNEINNLIEDTLDAITAHGDIIEQREIEDNQDILAKVLLYSAPPSFVSRSSGKVILLGSATNEFSNLPKEIERRIEHRTYVRILNPEPGEKLPEDLVRLGFVELEYKIWLKTPSIKTPAEHVLWFDKLLNIAQPSREIPGLSLLNPERPVRYYRGRWAEPRSQTGRFVARRRQAYGADLWSYVQVRNGHPESLIDFPLINSRWRGCDEAWHLQMAIDKERGEPQQFMLRHGPKETCVLELFSPVPMWATRRWNTIGELIPSSGCLFAYRFPKDEIEEELRFLHEMLWLEKMENRTHH